MKKIAVSRLMLDNIPHIKAYWIMMTPRIAQIAQRFGADDIDGTVVEEKIYHDAGATTSQGLRRGELLRLIREAGREPVERDTLYRPVTRTETTFTFWLAMWRTPSACSVRTHANARGRAFDTKHRHECRCGTHECVRHKLDSQHFSHCNVQIREPVRRSRIAPRQQRDQVVPLSQQRRQSILCCCVRTDRPPASISYRAAVKNALASCRAASYSPRRASMVAEPRSFTMLMTVSACSAFARCAL